MGKCLRSKYMGGFCLPENTFHQVEKHTVTVAIQISIRRWNGLSPVSDTQINMYSRRDCVYGNWSVLQSVVKCGLSQMTTTPVWERGGNGSRESRYGSQKFLMPKHWSCRKCISGDFRICFCTREDLVLEIVQHPVAFVFHLASFLPAPSDDSLAVTRSLLWRQQGLLQWV